MIQRIQTVYLLLVACFMAVLLFVPPADNISYYWPLLIVAAVTSLLAIVTIFQYKNRKRQIFICRLTAGLIVVYYLLFFASAVTFPFRFTIAEMGLRYPLCFPLLALIFNYMAIRGIRYDEKLVRSSDRLR